MQEGVRGGDNSPLQSSNTSASEITKMGMCPNGSTPRSLGAPTHGHKALHGGDNHHIEGVVNKAIKPSNFESKTKEVGHAQSRV